MRIEKRIEALVVCVVLVLSAQSVLAQAPAAIEYRVLATSKTSTMEKEMQEATEAGFRFGGVMGGGTLGGSEVVVVMLKDGTPGSYAYRLLATSRTSTMQKELQEAGDAGYQYRGQTVFNTALGGREVVVILERDGRAEKARFEYQLLSTKKTSTLQKELADAGAKRFDFVGLTVAKTATAGTEVVAILRRLAP